jgi:acyl carrier protein
MTNAEVESWVMDACRELGLPVASGDDNFFTAGGNSLSAVKLIAKAEEAFGEDALPPDDLFERSAIRDIALTIVAHRERAQVLD